MQGAWQSPNKVTHYGSWSGFLYYKPTTPSSRGLHLSATQRRDGQLCRFESWAPLPVPSRNWQCIHTHILSHAPPFYLLIS